MFVFAAVPTIFTKTAIEALIQDQGFAAQSAIAAILRGTPILLVAGAAAWAWHAHRATLAATFDGQPTGAVAARLFGLTVAMVFGWTLLGLDTRSGLVSGPIDAQDRSEAWGDLPGVAADDHFDRLQRPSKALWGFALVNGAFEEVSALLTGAVGVTAKEDPSQMIRSMVKLQATTLGEGDSGEALLSTFDALARNCGRSDARVLHQGGSIEDLFVTTVDPIGTDESGQDIDCAMLWRDFEEATAEISANAYMTDSNEGLGGLTSRFGWARFLELGVEWYGLEEEETTQWAVNAIIEGTLRNAAKRSSSGINPLRKDEATFSEGWPDYIVDVLVDGVVGEMALNAGSLIDPNIHLRAQKAEAAARFNEMADLIPTLRGFLHAAFAVAFPLCAYALALGFVNPMRSWLAGRAVLALYMPAAHLLYAMVSEFASWNTLANNPEYAWLSSEQTVVGALAILEAETLRVQTAYLMCEVAVFGSFAVGSARSLLLGGFGFGSSGAVAFGSGFGTVASAMFAGSQLARAFGRASTAGSASGAVSAARAAPVAGAAVAAGTLVVTTAVAGTQRHRMPPSTGASVRSF